MNSQTVPAIGESAAVAVAVNDVIRERDLDARALAAGLRHRAGGAVGGLVRMDQFSVFRAGTVFDDREMRGAGQLRGQTQNRNDFQHQTQAQQTRHRTGNAFQLGRCV